MPDPSEQLNELPPGGAIYEPRSLWSILNVDLHETEQLARFDREHFYNGTKYPITITRVAVSGINYTHVLNRTGSNPYQSIGAVTNRVQLALKAPFRQHYGKKPLVLNSLCPMPTAEPQPNLTVGAPFPVSPYRPSSRWGVSVLNFGWREMFMPALGSIEWDLSAGQLYGDPSMGKARAWLLYREEGGFFAGNARAVDFDVQTLQVQQYFPSIATAADYVSMYRDSSWPYIPDAFAGIYAGGTTPDFWDPRMRFSSKQFNAQQQTRAGSNKIIGLTAMIDQINMDEEHGFSQEIAPMSLRVGTRIRTTDTGSNEYWWREGAPLALTFDTITPATVYVLPYPITLARGDTLDLEAIVPGLPASVEDGLGRVMRIGVSFNGWATIEG